MAYMWRSLSATQHDDTLQLCWVSLFIYYYAECPYAECRYTECHYAECVILLSVVKLNVIMLNVIMQSVIMLSVIMLSVSYCWESLSWMSFCWVSWGRHNWRVWICALKVIVFLRIVVASPSFKKFSTHCLRHLFLKRKRKSFSKSISSDKKEGWRNDLELLTFYRNYCHLTSAIKLFFGRNQYRIVISLSVWHSRSLAPYSNIFRQVLRCQDTQHNDIQNNDIQHNDIQHNDIQHNDIHHNDIQHNDIQHNDTQ